VALPLLAERTLLALILIGVSVLVWSGYSGTEVDVVHKLYREYTSFFGIKQGKHLEFSHVEKIFVNRTKKTQRLYTAHTNHSSVFTNDEYNAFLKFGDGTKILLLTRRNKKKLLLALRKVAAALHVPVVDNTEVH
jgi:hypothetical protein